MSQNIAQQRALKAQKARSRRGLPRSETPSTPTRARQVAGVAPNTPRTPRNPPIPNTLRNRTPAARWQADAAETPISPLSYHDLAGTGPGMKAISKTNSLLALCGDTRDDWEPEGENYRKYQRRHHLATLHKLQTNIIEIITTRNAELETIHRRIRGHKQAKKFEAQINSRWSALDSTVKQYNKEVDKVAHFFDDNEQLPRKLELDKLKSDGITNDEMWDLDRMLTRKDWAVFKHVREGIDAMFRVDRAKEEQERMRLHAVRMALWLQHQSSMLLKLLEGMTGANDELPAIIMSPYSFEILLLQRLRMIRSMVDAKTHQHLLPEELKDNLIGMPFYLP